MNKKELFLKLLFNKDEHCNAGAAPWITSVYPAFNIPSYLTTELICINPLAAGKTRADANVVAYRSFLIECDEGSLHEQYLKIKATGLAISAIIFSGNKSLHVVVTLENDLESREQYDCLAERIYRCLKKHGLNLDTNCKNPSRSTRFPGVLRDSTKKEQKLIELNSRVKNAEIEAWLIKNDIHRRAKKVYPPRDPSEKRQLRASTRNFLMGVYESWNAELFKAACDILDSGFIYDEAVEMLEKITGHLDKKDISTVKSAEKRVLRK